MNASLNMNLGEISPIKVLGKVTDQPLPLQDPKFGNITEITMQFRVGGPWYTADLKMPEILSLLQTGEFDGQKVIAVEIFNVTSADTDPTKFIYNFMALNTGKNPWGME